VGFAEDIAVVIFIILPLFVHFFPVFDELFSNGASDMETYGAVLVVTLDAN